MEEEEEEDEEESQMSQSQHQSQNQFFDQNEKSFREDQNEISMSYSKNQQPFNPYIDPFIQLPPLDPNLNYES